MSERRLLWLLSAVQFVNVLDFILVMPLGADFARDLHIPLSHVGWIGGVYTGAAAIAGLVSARFLDRFDRRSALTAALLGLVIATACGGVSTSLNELLAARILAGAFGGPAAALSLSIIADVVPEERRGRAVGLVMASFSVASVLGVPAALELSRLMGWRWAFFAVAGMGLAIAGAALLSMPSLKLHLTARRAAARDAHTRAAIALIQPQSRVLVAYALATTITTMLAVFFIIPNLATYIQANLHYPRERLGLLYLVGGIASFIATRVLGHVTDRFGAGIVATFGSVMYISMLTLLFLFEVGLPVPLFYVMFMCSAAARAVSLGAVNTRVPLPHERASFMSLQSAVQHTAGAIGSIGAAQLLTELPDGSLHGMDHVAEVTIALAALLPFLLWRIDRLLPLRERALAAAMATVQKPTQPTRSTSHTEWVGASEPIAELTSPT